MSVGKKKKFSMLDFFCTFASCFDPEGKTKRINNINNSINIEENDKGRNRCGNRTENRY